MFSLFNLQGALHFCAWPLSLASFLILSQWLSFVKNFFQILLTFFNRLFISASLQATLALYQMVPEMSTSISLKICLNLTCFPCPFPSKSRMPCGIRPNQLFCCVFTLIPRPRSDRSRHRYACKPPQMRRRYLHRGKQRSCAQADSSAKSPRPVSSASY